MKNAQNVRAIGAQISSLTTSSSLRSPSQMTVIRKHASFPTRKAGRKWGPAGTHSRPRREILQPPQYSKPSGREPIMAKRVTKT